MASRLAILTIMTVFALPLIGSAAAEQDKSNRVKGIDGGTTKRATTVKSSKSNTSDRKGPVGGGQPAGIAVSDPGAEGSKPTKKSNK
jgi:hypothetical protein